MQVESKMSFKGFYNLYNTRPPLAVYTQIKYNFSWESKLFQAKEIYIIPFVHKQCTFL